VGIGFGCSLGCSPDLSVTYSTAQCTPAVVVVCGLCCHVNVMRLPLPLRALLKGDDSGCNVVLISI